MKSKRSSPKFSSSSGNLLSNKYVLYASFFFAIVTAANYLLRNNLEAIGIFIIIGLLTTFFSKNMIIVLLTTTILTNFLVMFRNRGISMMMENFTTEEIANLKEIMDDAKAAMDKAAMDKETDDAKKAELKKKYEEAKKNYDEAVAKPAGESAAAAAAKSTETKPTVTSDETFSMGAVPANTMQKPLGNKVADGMSQLNPAPVNGETINPMTAATASGMASGGNAQKEQALSVLSNMGGNGDMVAQQNEMINNLKSIEPILNTAQNFLDKFENSSISKMFSGSGGFPGMSLLTGGAGGNKTSPAPVGS